MKIHISSTELRAIYDDDYRFSSHTTEGRPVPVRASHVEVVPTGPYAGFHYVDMSPLGDRFQYCLWPPFDTRREALQAERHLVEKHWVEGAPQ